jgi:hypothetical protein
MNSTPNPPPNPHPTTYGTLNRRKYAWGDDEVDVLAHTPIPWFRLGLTIVDSIDTLMIAGLEEEYQEVRGSRHEPSPSPSPPPPAARPCAPAALRCSLGVGAGGIQAAGRPAAAAAPAPSYACQLAGRVLRVRRECRRPHRRGAHRSALQARHWIANNLHFPDESTVQVRGRGTS